MNDEKKNKNPHSGTDFEDYLKEKGIYEEIQKLTDEKFEKYTSPKFFMRVWLYFLNIYRSIYERLGKRD